MSLESQAIRVLDEWYGVLDRYQDRLPAKGSIAAALHVLDRLRIEYDLNIASHVTEGEAQIIGLSSRAIKRLLTDFGEARVLSSVAGRSNRGARGDVAALLVAMKPLHLETKSEAERLGALTAMQRKLVTAYIPLYFSVKRVRATFDINEATWRFVETILQNAKDSGKGGPVAEYLVGAKLALLYPGKEIRNKRFSVSDVQSGFSGDFELGNTVFHVTVAPMSELFEKCRSNLEHGLRVYLLVPESLVAGTRQNAELQAAGRITVKSIESFIATNIDELCDFDGNQLQGGLRRLLETYNGRVDKVEIDKSMLIDIPPNVG